MNKYLFPLLVVFAVVLIVGCGKLANVPGQVNPPASSLISILVSPESTSIAVSSTQQFSASGVMSSSTVSIAPTWEVIGGVGTIDATGLFTATNVGVGTVEARMGEVVGRAQVEVIPRVISGYVYDYYLSNPYSTDRVPISNANIYIGNNLVATTDSNGYYSATNVSAGEIILTAKHNDFHTMIVSSDKNSVDFCLTRKLYISLPAGSSTIQGGVVGMPDSIYSAYSSAYSYDNNRSSTGSYNNSTKSYIISQSPDNGGTYVSVSYLTREAVHTNKNFTYKKIYMNPGTYEVDMEYGDNSIDCNVLTSSTYRTSYATAYVCNGGRVIPILSSYKILDGQAVITMDKLPGLQAGDSFSVSIQAEGSDRNPILKYVHNVSGSVNIDISSMIEINYRDPTPAEGSIVTISPTIAWDPVAATNTSYYIYLEEYGGQRIFEAYTRSASIALPSIFVLESGKSYLFRVIAMSLSGFDIENLFSMNTSVRDQLIAAPPRIIVGGHTGSSSLGVKIVRSESAATRSVPEEILGIRLRDDY